MIREVPHLALCSELGQVVAGVNLSAWHMPATQIAEEQPSMDSPFCGYQGTEHDHSILQYVYMYRWCLVCFLWDLSCAAPPPPPCPA